MAEFVLPLLQTGGFWLAWLLVGLLCLGGLLLSCISLLGGLAGMVADTLVPPPILGSLHGMTAGSFAGAFLVERHRLQHAGQAARIAWGAVLARALVVVHKVATTLAMIVTLAVGIGAGR